MLAYGEMQRTREQMTTAFKAGQTILGEGKVGSSRVRDLKDMQVTAALLLLCCCFAAALLLPYRDLKNMQVTAALLLLYCCFTAALQLLYCSFTASLLLHYCRRCRFLFFKKVRD